MQQPSVVGALQLNFCPYTQRLNTYGGAYGFYLFGTPIGNILGFVDRMLQKQTVST
jgi:hypothetical protein